MIEIRDGCPSDDEAVAVVCESGLAELRKVYRPGPRAYEARASVNDKLFRLVAVVDSEVVGTVQYFTDSDSVRMMGLMVRSDFRRKGIAAALVGRLGEIAVEKGLPRLAARTIRETNNVVVFERLGFTVEAERPDTLFIGECHGSLTEVDLIRVIREGDDGVPNRSQAVGFNSVVPLQILRTKISGEVP